MNGPNRLEAPVLVLLAFLCCEYCRDVAGRLLYDLKGKKVRDWNCTPVAILCQYVVAEGHINEGAEVALRRVAVK